METKEVKWIVPCAKWNSIIQGEIEKEYMQTLSRYITKRRSMTNVYPSKEDVFKAFHLTNFWYTSVVIVGQDPYHTQGVAHGLSFSTLKGDIPPSLRNIFKEIATEYGRQSSEMFHHGNLTNWAEHGVLLLNRVLTVEEGQPESHAGKGWELFTDAIIKSLNEHTKPIVYMLWGKKAQEVERLIAPHHIVLKSAHPSPLSADKFFGCGHFKECNKHLLTNYGKIINWELQENTSNTQIEFDNSLIFNTNS